MVKKSEADRFKDDLSRRSKKWRERLDGPYTCPKCGRANALFCKTQRKVVKKFTLTTLFFSCRSCNYRRLVTKRGKSPDVIDVYCRVYDEDISQIQRSAQGEYRPMFIRVLSLPKTEVKMR